MCSVLQLFLIIWNTDVWSSRNNSKTNERKDLITDCSCNECSTNRSSCQVDGLWFLFGIRRRCRSGIMIRLKSICSMHSYRITNVPQPHTVALSQACYQRRCPCVRRRVWHRRFIFWSLHSELCQQLSQRSWQLGKKKCHSQLKPHLSQKSSHNTGSGETAVGGLKKKKWRMRSSGGKWRECLRERTCKSITSKLRCI